MLTLTTLLPPPDPDDWTLADALTVWMKATAIDAHSWDTGSSPHKAPGAAKAA